ncbi:MAG: hypothetical protein QNJ71_04705 [Acidimicrobiia bacterium]|nr:hypothetical protein [Acidimicrobiia bacterium]
MRRPTTILAVIAVAVVAIALFIRSSGDDTTASDEVGSTSSTTTDVDSSTTPSENQTTTTPSTTTAPSEPSTTTLPVTPVPPGIVACDLYDEILVTGSVASEDLVEASGLAASRTTSSVLWSHNDSRGGARLHALGLDGGDLGSYDIPGAFALDWEDIGTGPGPDGTGSYLYVGDIGDNFGIRDGLVTVFRVEDISPDALDGEFPASEPIVYVMPDGPFDAEALFIDPLEPALYIVTKSRSEAFVFKGPVVPTTNEPHVMELQTILFLDAEVSGADITPDGGLIAFRGYRTVWMWTRENGEPIAEALGRTPCEAPSPEEVQGESIAFDSQLGYYTISEGQNPPVHHVPAGS